MEREPMLALEGLTARYGLVTALDGVSLTVAAAEFVCLIGSNGAGKTTTLKAISGLVAAAAGRIRFEGKTSTGSRRRRFSGAGSRIARKAAGCFPT